VFFLFKIFWGLCFFRKNFFPVRDLSKIKEKNSRKIFKKLNEKKSSCKKFSIDPFHWPVSSEFKIKKLSPKTLNQIKKNLKIKFRSQKLQYFETNKISYGISTRQNQTSTLSIQCPSQNPQRTLSHVPWTQGFPLSSKKKPLKFLIKLRRRNFSPNHFAISILARKFCMSQIHEA